MIDESTGFGKRVARHLTEDDVVWLTTVTAGGQPVPNPVWFFWDGKERVRIYTLPDSLRVRTLKTNPKVSLNFRGTETGGDVVVLNGVADVLGEVEPAYEHPAYVEKYAGGLKNLDLTPERFSQQYSTVVDIRITKVRGF